MVVSDIKNPKAVELTLVGRTYLCQTEIPGRAYEASRVLGIRLPQHVRELAPGNAINQDNVVVGVLFMPIKLFRYLFASPQPLTLTDNIVAAALLKTPEVFLGSKATVDNGDNPAELPAYEAFLYFFDDGHVGGVTGPDYRSRPSNAPGCPCG